MTEPIPSLAEAMAEIRRLRARITDLTAALAIIRGTLAQPEVEAAFHVEHNLPPSAPPHDEP